MKHLRCRGVAFGCLNSRLLVVLVGIVLAAPVAAQAPLQQLHNIGDLQLQSGSVLESVKLGFRTAGTLNSDRSNILLFPTWFTGTSLELFNNGQIGPGKMADTDRFFVIAIDALSNGVSTSPSNWQGGAGEEFPAVSVADMVRSQHRLLTRYLEIDHAAAVMGISMGGMQALQWLGQYPGFVDKAVAINGSPRMTSYDLVQWQTHESAIEHLLNAGIANPEIMQFLTRLNLITLWTPRYFIANVQPQDLPAFMEVAEQGYVHFDARNYLSQLRAMMAHNVYAGFVQGRAGYVQANTAEVLMIALVSDQMVMPAPGRELSDELKSSYVAIESACGHMGSVCDADQIADIIHSFMP